MNEKLNKLLFGAGVLGGLALGASSCSSNKSDDKEEAKTEVKAKEQQDATYGDFKKRMQQITPLVMVQTILIEGAEFDDNGLCKPYSKRLNNGKKDKWTHGFGITQMDGKAVTKNTRHITVQEAWEKSVDFYENVETYYFMWCYEIGIDGLYIDTQEKALGFADVMYNANTSCIENKNSTTHCERNEKLRDLYEKYGDNVNAEQVKEVFAKYPIRGNYSFYKALNGGTTEDWANSLGGFCAEGGGIYWRRWLQGQLAMGNITYKDLLDLPMKSMYEFWCVVGKNKSALFNTNNDGTITVKPEALKKFKEWAKNPVDKNGNKITCETVRQLINSIDPTIVSKIENGDYVWQDVSGGKSSTYVILPANEDKTVNVDSLNDESLYAYQAENYDKSLQDAALALKFAQTNKQRGAAHFNKGMAYMGMCKYGRAKDCFEKSLAENKTKAAQDQLNIAQEKLSEKRKKSGKVALGLGLGLLGVGAIYGGRKYYLAQQQKKGMRR